MAPAQDCIVDKIQELARNWPARRTDPEEQILALKFLLHFVADVHQPLHAADSHDRGGNDKRVSAIGFMAGNLHHYWDTAFVGRLGPNARRIAADLKWNISEREVQAWSRVGPPTGRWSRSGLPETTPTVVSPHLTAAGAFGYKKITLSWRLRTFAVQLSKAGVRLAFVLNKALGPTP